MSRRLGAVAILACAACVPASEALPPAGGFGFVTEPTPATRGESFVTSDGWTVSIETIAMHISVSAETTQKDSVHFGNRTETYRIDASKSVVVYTRAIPVGAVSGGIGLTSNYVGDGNFRENEDDYVTNANLSGELNARFKRVADASPYQGDYAPYGPSLVIVARAEKGDVVMRLDAAMDVYSGSLNDRGRFQGEVIADTLATTPVTIRGEALFEGPPGVLTFDDLAAADLNNDGYITGPELAVKPESCRDCGVDDYRGTSSLFERLRLRCAGLFTKAIPR